MERSECKSAEVRYLKKFLKITKEKTCKFMTNNLHLQFLIIQIQLLSEDIIKKAIAKLENDEILSEETKAAFSSLQCKCTNLLLLYAWQTC